VLSKETEEKILKAATAVFTKKGRAGTSMQDIAVEAGINRTLLNYYFRSKDKLFDQVFQNVFLQFMPAINERLKSDKSIIDRIEDVIDHYFFILIDNPMIPVFIFQELTSNPARLVRNFREEGLDPSYFISLLRDEMSKGNLRKMDPRIIIVNLLSMVIFPFAARPVIENLMFEGSDEEYMKFLRERKKDLKTSFIDSIKP